MMKRAVACGNWRRTAFGLAAPAALIVAVGGSALAASAPAAAAVGGVSTATCTVHWVGTVYPYDWTTAKNWSTGKVPGPADDVCIGAAVAVQTNASVTIPWISPGQHKLVAVGSEGSHAAITITVS